VLERAPLLRQLILHAHRRLGHDDAIDDALGLEHSQALREHAIADVGNGDAEFREPHPSVKQELDDRTRPTAADQLDGAVKSDAETRLEAHALDRIRRSHLTQSTYLIIVPKF
jgi:hypothetical protein